MRYLIIGSIALSLMGCSLTMQQRCDIVSGSSEKAAELLELEQEDKDLTLEALDIVDQAITLAVDHAEVHPDSVSVFNLLKCSVEGIQDGLE
jgi:hypothetical protein|tara:strand:+ start:15388 stop:15663 length:276 start_codon:yes stop_codon:yes gene_type:complete